MTPPRTSSIFVISMLVSLVVTTGCSGQKELLARRNAQIDSLTYANRTLEADLGMLRDTLQFYDDIETGQYYRDRRMLAQQIEELRYHFELCRDGGLTIETLLVDDLFEPASATLMESGTDRLDMLGDVLREKYAGRVIRIEGHADSTPIGPALLEAYPSNWELSADRAGAIVRYLIDEEEIPAGQVVLSSHGSTRPVAKNDSPEGRRQNRRIRIAVLP